MDETEWLSSNDPGRMLTWLNTGRLEQERRRVVSDRKLRLFAVACCRAVFYLLTDPRSRNAVEVAERYADGEATAKELDRAAFTAWLVPQQMIDDGPDSDRRTRAARCAGWAARNASEVGYVIDEFVLPKQATAALLRNIVGNPFRVVKLVWECGRCRGCGLLDTQTSLGNEHEGYQCHRCGGAGVTKPDWINCTVLALAASAYTERAEDGTLCPDRLGILADALEDAGCPETVECRCDKGLISPQGEGEPWTICPRCPLKTPGRIPHPILQHLRSPDPHVRGCWCLDLLLGRS